MERGYRRLTIMAKKILVAVFLTVVLLGWKYPALGYALPVVMVTGLMAGLLKGRYLCGNLCPRGAFLASALPGRTPKKSIPSVFFQLSLRWSIFAFLMGFMIFRLWMGPLSFRYAGLVFWQTCLITSVVAVVLALKYSARSWCAFCPMGTVQRALGGVATVFKIDERLCRRCAVCEAACPLGLSIISQKSLGSSQKDCIHCRKCVAACPADAIK